MVQLEDGIGSCGEYDLSVTAVLQSQYSQDALLTFLTPPDMNIALDLDPIVLPDHDSISVKWRGWEKLSCIRQYQVVKKY